MTDKDEIIKFPYATSIKVIGEGQDFFQFVITTVNELAGPIDLEEVLVRNSAGEKYISVTVPFVAKNRPMLEEVYRRLSGDERTRFVI